MKSYKFICKLISSLASLIILAGANTPVATNAAAGDANNLPSAAYKCTIMNMLISLPTLLIILAGTAPVATNTNGRRAAAAAVATNTNGPRGAAAAAAADTTNTNAQRPAAGTTNNNARRPAARTTNTNPRRAAAAAAGAAGAEATNDVDFVELIGPVEDCMPRIIWAKREQLMDLHVAYWLQHYPDMTDMPVIAHDALRFWTKQKKVDRTKPHRFLKGTKASWTNGALDCAISCNKWPVVFLNRDDKEVDLVDDFILVFWPCYVKQMVSL